MTLNWEELLPLAIAVIMLIVKTIQGGKYKKYLDAALALNRTVYSAVEEAKATDVKKLVTEAVIASTNIKLVELNTIILPVVDSVKAKDAPPLKRFWRRLLSGQNLAGVALRVAAQGAIKKHLEDK